MAGVALTATPSAPVVSSSYPSSTSVTAATVTASTTLLFGVPAPKAAADKLFLVSSPDGVAQERVVAKGWRLQALKPTLTVRLTVKADGTSVVTGEGWNVPVRSTRGVSYNDVQLLGLFDATHAAVMARGDRVVLLSVSRIGEVRELLRIPDAVLSLDVTQNAAWLSLFQTGEGLEAGPQGPSALVRLTMDGASSTIATDGRVISLLSVGPSGSVAYGFDTGEMVAVTADQKRWNGIGRPLLWLDARHLVMAQGVAVQIVDVPASQVTPLVDLPAAPMIGVIPDTL